MAWDAGTVCVMQSGGVAVPSTVVEQVLESLYKRGIAFDTTSRSCLKRFNDVTQISVLEKVQELQYKSALPHSSVLVQANAQEQTSPSISALGPTRVEHQSASSLEPSGRAHVDPCAKNVEDVSNVTMQRASFSTAGCSEKRSGICPMPPSQSSQGIVGCTQVVSNCLRGASEPYAVQHALSCNSDLAYLTGRRIRGVESFPWQLPGGWYALHVAQNGHSESLQRQVASTGVAVPGNLPSNCIVAVMKLGFSTPFQDFNNEESWALGKWCHVIEDIVMLENCVPVMMQELQRLWTLPETVRAQVHACIPKHLCDNVVRDRALTEPTTCGSGSVFAEGKHSYQHTVQSGEISADRSPLMHVSTPARSAHSLVCEAENDCKRARLGMLSHASFPQSAPVYLDRLQRLYPHPRDQDCYLDDKLHRYLVHGQPYSLSVSGWWKMFFEDFDPKQVSERIVKRHLDTPGFRSSASDAAGDISQSVLASSVYNFAQHVRIFERRSDEEFLDQLRAVAGVAKHDYEGRCGRAPFAVETIVDLGRHFLLDPQKAGGPSCYYLMFLYTASCTPEGQAAQIAQTWELHGSLESLKGTFMHKKIELFINAMARPMERDGTLHVAVEDLLREQPPAHEYAAEAVMKYIAWAQDPQIWDHPVAQRFFQSEVRGESLEFRKFRAWLSTKSRWTPFRLEWSLYNEDLKVAGQIDSLWMDLDRGGTLVMADWKRARELLTDDVLELERQAFGKMGTSCCAHLFDVAWSHYFVQQTLYAYLLASKYGLLVRDMILVQCHPHVCGSQFNEAFLVADFALARSLAAFLQSGHASASALGELNTYHP